MTQLEAVNAYKALSHLAVQTLPIKTAYALHKLRRALAPAWDFQVAQGTALIERYGGTIDGGSVRFGQPDDPDAIKRALAYSKEIAELNGLEAEAIPDLHPHVPLDDNLVLTMQEVDALDGIVIFDGGDEPHENS
jgi:hypothetical protein